MSDYSTKAYRAFKKFVGELTASAAGIQTAAEHVTKILASSESDDPWRHLAKQYEIKVNGLDSDALLRSNSRLNIVSLYSGFDLFLSDFRAQYHDINHSDWKKNDSDSPFDEIYRNSSSNKKDLDDRLGASRKATIDYYRYIRNAVVHPTQENKARARSFFLNNTAHLDSVRALYSMRSAPNSDQALSFHDVKLLAHLLLDVLREVDLEFDPGDAVLATLLDSKPFKKFRQDAVRYKNALKGTLREQYGISDLRADRVIMLHLGPMS
ncbi:hypothetical protein LGN19_01535 [Burkholderia sp. AU30198]|uniref:hypothetical protein n=1 Tax=Burkholderia sp. AU30198 TaxID=2879627 RepID=UPI001CF2C8AC|nr:hypothetical protein [Burkholderia sp. AU30198]MCA8292463.1 hypothetical protein [Burkholderia sp. AU30198]